MKHLIIGSGRLARHLEFYFKSYPFELSLWNRKDHSHEELNHLSSLANWIWIVIRDDAIEDYANLLSQYKQKLIHCSGALITDLASDAHFLSSFGSQLFDLNFYSSIPIVTSTKSLFKNYSELGLKNPIYLIAPSKKLTYHAACVLASPGSVCLWQFYFNELNKWGIPIEHSKALLESTNFNLIHDSKNALTGPWVRQDSETINKNLIGLSNFPEKKIMEAFIEHYNNQNKKLLSGESP